MHGKASSLITDVDMEHISTQVSYTHSNALADLNIK